MKSLARGFFVISVATFGACGVKKPAYQPLDAKRANSVSALNSSFTLDTLSLDSSVPIDLRWTEGETAPLPSLDSIVAAVNAKADTHLVPGDFRLSGEQLLANSKYSRFVQLKGGEVVHNRSIRTWSTKDGARLIQAEAFLDRPEVVDGQGPVHRQMARSQTQALLGNVTHLNFRTEQSVESTQLIAQARKILVTLTEDTQVRGIATRREWHGATSVQAVEIKGRYGRHTFLFNSHTGGFLKHRYRGFLESDAIAGGVGRAEYTLPGKIFPIWEFPEGDPTAVTELMNTRIRHLQASVHTATDGAYDSLAANQYLYSKYDTEIGNTLPGRVDGFWNNDFIRNEVAKIFGLLPNAANLPGVGRPSRIEGRYAGIYLHPDAPAQFPDLNFHPDPSPQFYLKWTEVADSDGDWEGKPFTLKYGKPVVSPLDMLHRAPFNTNGQPDNEPQRLVNSGFDEVQVYAGITYLFETLHTLGFSDPELSTRPIAAILYDPSLDFKDNAYYDNDTINFATYSAGAQNYARDNTTIWHELGHGIMDRLMGSHLNFADTGGLSEGMADFIAQLVINSRTCGEDFPGFHALRIFNKTAFHLTNEVHDDGEAYGGAMNDVFVAAVTTFGFEEALKRIGDLVLETMRLTRDHPVLTAEVWFERMIFADSLVREIPGLSRQPGELRQLIVRSLTSRNFSLAASDVPASLLLRNDEIEITSDAAGSRENPVPVTMGSEETRSFNLSTVVDPGSFFAFQFPLTVRVMFEGGPLQGAAKWVGQDSRYKDYTLTHSGERLAIPVTLQGTCEYVNRDDGGCKDYIYVQILNTGEEKYPVAKKRFYVVLKP
jgi:hypothetical protein